MVSATLGQAVSSTVRRCGRSGLAVSLQGQDSSKHRAGVLRHDERLHWMGIEISLVGSLHPQEHALLV